mgnify:CR=1 FL=1
MKPIAPAVGIAFAFPDVCKTPAPPGSPVPIPYPNIAQLADADAVTDESNKELLVGPNGDHVLLEKAVIQTSSGDEAGSVGGVKSGGIKGKCEIVQASSSVVYGPEEKGIVRFMDATTQNDENASGFVMGAFPTVLVGD